MKVRDEVCGMDFEAADASVTMRLDGKVYYFCGDTRGADYRHSGNGEEG